MQRVPERPLENSSPRFDEFPRHYQALLQTTDPVASERSLRELFAGPLKQFEQALQFDCVCFLLHDSARNLFVLHPLSQTGEYESPAEIPVENVISGLVLHEQETIEVQDVHAHTDASSSDLLEMAKKRGFRSLRFLPLTTQRRKLGILAVGRRSPGTFSHEDVRFLSQTADLVALILENALMAEVVTREKTRIETLLDVNTALVSSLDIQKLFIAISGSMRRIVGRDFTHFAMYDQPSNAMKIYALDSSHANGLMQPETAVPISECPAGIALWSGEAKLFTTADLESIGSGFTRELLAKGIRAVCCFPMVSCGRTLGTLGIASLKENPLSPHDIELLTQVAAQIAVAVDNARAYAEIASLKDKLAKEKLYLEDEIRSAHNSEKVIGNSPALKHVLQQVEIAAPSDATVLILGETGTGKELVAHALH